MRKTKETSPEFQAPFEKRDENVTIFEQFDCYCSATSDTIEGRTSVLQL